MARQQKTRKITVFLLIFLRSCAAGDRMAGAARRVSGFAPVEVRANGICVTV
jgi:hypothetical protein